MSVKVDNIKMSLADAISDIRETGGGQLALVGATYDPDYKEKLKEEYKFGPTIGSGSSGVVVVVKNVSNGEIYALKIIKNKSLEPEYLNEFEYQLASSGCQYIASVYKATQTLIEVYILMEYINGKELYKKLKEVKTFSSTSTRRIVCQIAKALECIHGNNIIYNDLKLENIMIDIHGDIKLIDFGLSVSSEIESYGPIGTLDYISPEKIKCMKPYNKPSDIWALGVLYYELLVGSPPFEHEYTNQTYKNILKCDITFPKTMNKDDVDNIKKILLVNPDSRPTAQEVVDMLC
jgi:aurora kinase